MSTTLLQYVNRLTSCDIFFFIFTCRANSFNSEKYETFYLYLFKNEKIYIIKYKSIHFNKNYIISHKFANNIALK